MGGAELKKLRKAHRLTQRALGELLGYHANYISRLESGQEPITPRFEKVLSSVLKGYVMLPQTRAAHQRAAMTGAEFRARRLELGYTVRDLARLLDCAEVTIRNLETIGAGRRPSRQIEQMMLWLSNPIIRERVEKMQKKDWKVFLDEYPPEGARP